MHMPAPSPLGRSLQRSLRPSPLRREVSLALAAVLVVLSVGGCASSPPPPSSSPSALFEPGGSGLVITPALIAGTLGDDDGLCIRTVGPLAACTPRPKVKRVLGEVLRPALTELSALPAEDQPAWVVCYLNRRETPPRYDCTEVYGLKSR